MIASRCSGVLRRVAGTAVVLRALMDLWREKAASSLQGLL